MFDDTERLCLIGRMMMTGETFQSPSEDGKWKFTFRKPDAYTWEVELFTDGYLTKGNITFAHLISSQNLDRIIRTLAAELIAYLQELEARSAKVSGRNEGGQKAAADLSRSEDGGQA